MKIIILVIILVTLIHSYNYSNFKKEIIIYEDPESYVKLDDFYFINKDTGWVISGIDSLKKIYMTNNSGIYWETIYQSTEYIFRSIYFKDSKNGFIGTLDSSVLLYTNDGGYHWQNCSFINNIKPEGVCSLYGLGNKYIFGCGKYSKPADFIKSSDSGLTWECKRLPNEITSAVDCYFINQNTGFIAGGYSKGDYNNSKAVILKTTSGGIDWEVKYRSMSDNQMHWKICFINDNTGYVSIQSLDINIKDISYIKTTNKGNTWEEKSFKVKESGYGMLGIYFENSDTGYIGGMRISDESINGENYYTINGGKNWLPDFRFANINKFRKVGEQLFASGKNFYKITIP
ncbi:MAG: hypothetical protein WAT71_14515 [Ignavibacteria bacterium]